MITTDNYELYFTDYLDGTLPLSKAAELKTFLLLHPELETLLEDMDQVKLKAPRLRFEQKELLKEICMDHWADQGPKLVPDRQIRFEKKRLLYRKNSYRALFFRVSAVAALLALCVTLGLSFLKRSPLPELPGVRVTRIESVPAPVVKIKPEALYAQPVNLPEKLHLTRAIQVERIAVIGVIPGEEIAVVRFEAAPATHPAIYLSAGPSSEILLNDKANEWKSSVNNFQSKDIFTSVFHAGKNITDKMKNNDVLSENRMR